VATDDYGQGVTLPALTDSPNIETFKGIINALVQHSVMRFASASARTAAIASPVEGMHSTLDDTNLLYRYDGSTWRAVAPPMQTGQVSVSFSNLALYTTTVTFPVPFTSTPRVFTNIASLSGPTARWGARGCDVSTTQFTLFLFAGELEDGEDTWSSIPVQWLAVGS
jgi:hypothetical protein